LVDNIISLGMEICPTQGTGPFRGQLRSNRVVFLRCFKNVLLINYTSVCCHLFVVGGLSTSMTRIAMRDGVFICW